MSTIDTIAEHVDPLDFDVTSAAVLDGLFGAQPRAPKVGRYRLGAQIGQGAMGRVYRAHDPDLGREVAIKMIHVEGRDDPRARARLVREAQALAQVNHPNVVAVFEVGTYRRDVYVAMEWLRGKTLRRWRADLEPTAAQCLRVLVQAGEGLGAAHQAGVVHRDFKPDNVLVADDGRVRVIDFGLAQTGTGGSERVERAAFDAGTTAAAVSGALGDGMDLSSGGSITRTGTVLGSPAYMPPEQLVTSDVDAHSDQFAFCVTAFETLHGVRPFEGRTPAQVLANIVDGRIRVVGDEVPRGIDSALRRGLSCDPEDRWPTMEALLEQLSATDGSRRRVLVVAGVAVLAVGGVLASTRPDERTCATDEDSLAGVWDAELRAAVTERVGGEPGQRIAASLDAYADAWLQTRETACREASSASTSVNVSAAELDAQRARVLHCLRRRQVELEASVDLLRVADTRTREHAEAVVAGLARPERCLDAGDPAPDSETTDPREARRIAVVEDALARAAALEHAGHWDEAVAAIQPALQPAPPQSWLEAEVRHRYASSLGKLKRTPEAIEQAQQAFFVAQRAGDEQRAAALATRLVCYVGWDSADAGAAEAWIEHAEALLRRLGDPPALSIELEWCRAKAETQAGDTASAIESFRRSIALAERAGSGPMRLAMLEHDLATALIDAGRISQARPLLVRSMATLEQVLGSEHPQLGTSHQTLGNALAMTGDLEGARPHFEAALSIRRQSDPHGIDVAMALGNLGILAHQEKRLADARALLEEALVSFESLGGPADPRVHATLSNLAANATSRGDFDEARRLLRRQIELVTAYRGADHPSAGIAYNLLGDVERDAGVPAEAEVHYRRAVQIFERRRGSEHPDLGYPLTGLGEVLFEQGELEESEQTLRRALVLRSGADIDPKTRESTEDALQRTLRAMGRQPDPVDDQTSG